MLNLYDSQASEPLHKVFSGVSLDHLERDKGLQVHLTFLTLSPGRVPAGPAMMYGVLWQRSLYGGEGSFLTAAPGDASSVLGSGVSTHKHT